MGMAARFSVSIESGPGVQTVPAVVPLNTGFLHLFGGVITRCLFFNLVCFFFEDRSQPGPLHQNGLRSPRVHYLHYFLQTLVASIFHNTLLQSEYVLFILYIVFAEVRLRVYRLAVDAFGLVGHSRRNSCCESRLTVYQGLYIYKGLFVGFELTVPFGLASLDRSDLAV